MKTLQLGCALCVSVRENTEKEMMANKRNTECFFAPAVVEVVVLILELQMLEEKKKDLYLLQ